MVKSKSLKRWATVYRGLGNPSRLRILELLRKNKQLSVSELSKELGITLKNTSRNLGILLNLELVEFQGKHDRVYYSLNPNLHKDIKQILKISI